MVPTERNVMNLMNRLRSVTIRSTATLGLALILASVVGVLVVIRANNAGEPILLAREFIAAGTVVSDDMIVDARIVGAHPDATVTRADIVGRTTGIDVGAGELLSHRAIDERVESRTIVAIPLGVIPAELIEPGSTVTLWEVDGDGVNPPVAIADSATLLAVADGSLGSEARATVLLDPAAVDRVLGAVGASALIVATSGSTP